MKYLRPWQSLLGALLLCTAGSKEAARAQPVPPRNIFAEKGLVHVLGPSPAILPSADLAAVDSSSLESCDVLKDDNTYYWYYHALSKDKTRWPRKYRICVATAPAPLGPWKKYEQNPVLDHGPEGSWDAISVDGAVILKASDYRIRHGTEKYYMWYSAIGAVEEEATGARRHIGLATASNPLGPWKKYEGNPVAKGFGYLGGVVKVGKKYFMYTQWPVSSTFNETDQGAFYLATADRPEGPWTTYQANSSVGIGLDTPPVLAPGDWGAWDDGGFSEARVRYHEGVFHCFYGGTKTEKLESIGYAFSFDGVHWTKYGANPVVDLSRVPDASGLAEVHAMIEGPNVYLYHTLRYFTGEATARGTSHTEDLGIQVLTIDPHFKIAMPVLALESLAAKQTSRVEECLPIGLESASGLALSVRGTYDPAAGAGLRLHLRASDDGVRYDTTDLYAFEIPLDPGSTVRKTVELRPTAKYLKVVVENRDGSRPATAIDVKATVGN